MNQNHDHVGDDAALYALGMLEDDERARVDAHVRRCAPCAERLGEAEATVAAMAETALAPRAPRRLPAWAALAAAFLLALTSAVLGAQNAGLRHDLAADGTVLATLVRSHFLHAQFVAAGGVPVDAKVIYERRGGWYEIVALRATPAWRVEAIRPNGHDVVLPGRFAVRGEAGVLDARGVGPVRQLLLYDAAGRLVGSVRPVSEDDAARR